MRLLFSCSASVEACSTRACACRGWGISRRRHARLAAADSGAAARGRLSPRGAGFSGRRARDLGGASQPHARCRREIRARACLNRANTGTICHKPAQRSLMTSHNAHPPTRPRCESPRIGPEGGSGPDEFSYRLNTKTFVRLIAISGFSSSKDVNQATSTSLP